MRLRELEIGDACRMLEWMHDPFVVEKMQTDFLSKTMEDCRSFILNSKDKNNIHLAIADDDNRYMGTVSLKHLSETNAEFAITVRRDAMGKGYSIWAMREIIRRGFEEYGLTDIYWCVAPDNARALRFYDKNAFPRVPIDAIKNMEGYTKEQIDDYVWYQVSDKSHRANN